ncbi:MAG: hypothetical protein N3A59_01850 [Thermodesulfovibrionales bacterium]|nr:hypothetical protein [Thermodesulfovibrionales bacterium]
MIYVLIIIFLFISPFPAKAHKVNVYAYSYGEVVHTEGYFADGSKCKGCDVVIYDSTTNKFIAEGKTDENGMFSFQKPDAYAIKIILKGGAGHQSSYLLTLKDHPKKDSLKNKIKDELSKDALLDLSLSQKEKSQCLKQSDIEFLINQALDKKIQPLTDQIAMLHEDIRKASILQIIGGIGYIFGVMGLVLYFKSKKS